MLFEARDLELAASNALGIEAASFAERSGAKIERKARRLAGTPKEIDKEYNLIYEMVDV